MKVEIVCKALGIPVPKPFEVKREDVLKEIFPFVVPVQVDPFSPFLRLDDEFCNLEKDVWLLTHQNSLEFASISNINDALISRFQNVSKECPYLGKDDKDIMSFIKSKNIQCMSELESWISYLEQASINDEAAKQALDETKGEETLVEEKSKVEE